MTAPTTDPFDGIPDIEDEYRCRVCGAPWDVPCTYWCRYEDQLDS